MFARLGRHPWFRWLSPLLIAAIGIGLVAEKGKDHAMWEESRTWPSTAGTVVRVYSLKPSKPAPGGLGGRAQVKDHITITYQYEVKGRSYQSRRFTYSVSGNAIESEELASFRATRKVKTATGTTSTRISGTPKTGDLVTVLFKPDEPQLSVLRVGRHFQWRSLSLFIGGFLILFGAIFLFKAWRD
jgi:hypothetical protein